MHSTLICNKIFYSEVRDGNIQVVEPDAQIVASLKQDLIGERAVTNGFNFQEIFDKDLKVCGIYSKKFSTRTLISAGMFILASMKNCAVSNNLFL